MMTREELRLAFCQMFGVSKVYDFQVEVAYQLLVLGKSVILQAPTGSGKTWTALFPFFLAWLRNLDFSRKCLYAVPLRVLTEQFRETAEGILAAFPANKKLNVRIQTGADQGDRTFEGDLIFTTIDQVISSALSVPYSLSRRQANVNAGAVFSSFLVCDELHLFPVDEQSAQGALATLIEMLHTLGKALPFLLMTATLSNQMLSLLERELDVAKVVVSAEELAEIESQQKTRRYHAVSKPLSAQAILDHHQTRSIVICNQVTRAIELYDELRRTVNDDPSKRGKTHVLLLHSRFIKRHRGQKERLIRRQFKRQMKAIHQLFRIKNLIIVATQVIEVGLDITCERLHTELAPANAIIQRAGRCARYMNEEGDIFIYLHPVGWNEQEPLSRPYLPYGQEQCEATWQAISQERWNGKALSFLDEQAIVSLVHNPTDERLFTRILSESYGRWEAMTAAMFRGEKEGRARLIRQTDSRTLLIHHDPTQILSPYTWKGFSLFHGTLRGWIHDLRESGQSIKGMMWFPAEPENDAATEKSDPLKDTYSSNPFIWKPVIHEGSIDESPLFVIHPRMVSYDRDHGFQLQPATHILSIAALEQEPEATQARQFETRYALEHYSEHISNMLVVYRERSTLSIQIALTAKRLAAAYGYEVTTEEIETAMLLALALHDAGKLQVEWQRWSHAYQEKIGELMPETMMIVHTHYTPNQEELHCEAEQALQSLKRPPHAAEGAWATWPILLRALNQNEWLAQAVFTAITRHHSAFSTTITPYVLHTSAPHAIEEALALIGLPGYLVQSIEMQETLFPQHGALDDRLLITGDVYQWLVYTLIVRTLRLCDGKSLEGM